jgi:hypothetical protein
MSCSTVEISFPDAERQKLFCNDLRLRAAFGDRLADKISCRLQLLKWARSLMRVPKDPPIALSRNGGPAAFRVSLGGSDQLEFEALEFETLSTGDADPATVRSVNVLGVARSPSIKGSKK